MRSGLSPADFHQYKSKETNKRGPRHESYYSKADDYSESEYQKEENKDQESDQKGKKVLEKVKFRDRSFIMVDPTKLLEATAVLISTTAELMRRRYRSFVSMDQFSNN